MIEFASNDFYLPGIVVEMALLAGNFEMSRAGEIAGDTFFFDDALGARDGFERGGVHAARKFAAILRNQFIDSQLQSGEHHAAVTRTSAPADGFRFQHYNLRSSF